MTISDGADGPVLLDGTGIAIELVKSLTRLGEITTEWQSLLDRVGSTSPFLHPAFLLPWYSQAEQDRLRTHLMAAWRGKRLVGLLPLSLKSSGIAGLSHRRLSPPLYGSTPPFDLVTSEPPASLLMAIDLFFERLLAWDRIHWPAMPAQSLVSTLVTEHLRRKGHSVRIVPVESRFSVDTRNGWDNYFASIRSHYRNEIKRQGRVAERMGGARVETFRPGGANFEEHLVHARMVIGASWKNSDEMVERGLEHLERMSRSLSEAGMFFIHTLFLGGKPVAYLSEIEHEGRRYAFHIAYDDEYAVVSPGTLVLMSAIRMAFEDEMQSYEFCGYRDYLRRLSNVDADFCSVDVTNRSVLSHLKVGGLDLLRRLADQNKFTHSQVGARQ
ncbi:GNAT family N-acetyltransferase [Mesorhizobium mediterraneum]|uniref:GNAT family N-acetyltransferase n=1 Tax=Mesorhizobium mediterraneum TaxID=43617 RepID=UPI00177F0AB5|nr:GNAT family N-acetyltransferase [Mesorhizobium mediterraneum]